MLRGYFDLILDCWKITVFMNKSINIHYVGTYLRPWYHHPYTHWIIQPTCFQFGCGWKYSLLVDVTTRYILYKVCHKHKRAGKLKNRLSGWESILRPLPDPFKILIVSDNWQAFTIWKWIRVYPVAIQRFSHCFRNIFCVGDLWLPPTENTSRKGALCVRRND